MCDLFIGRPWHVCVGTVPLHFSNCKWGAHLCAASQLLEVHLHVKVAISTVILRQCQQVISCAHILDPRALCERCTIGVQLPAKYVIVPYKTAQLMSLSAHEVEPCV